MYEQFKKQIEPIVENKNSAYGNFNQLGIDLIQQSYLNCIDEIIEYHKRQLKITQGVNNKSIRNLIYDGMEVNMEDSIYYLQEQRKLISEHE